MVFPSRLRVKETDAPEVKKSESEPPEEAKPSNPFGRKTVPRPESGTRLSALEIHENIRGPAVEELERPASSLVFSALAAGMLIGFRFLPPAFLAPPPPPAPQ